MTAPRVVGGATGVPPDVPGLSIGSPEPLGPAARGPGLSIGSPDPDDVQMDSNTGQDVDMDFIGSLEVHNELGNLEPEADDGSHSCC